MSTSSLSSYSSYSALSTAKKTPKRLIKDCEPNEAEVIMGQLDTMKLELDTFKINMVTTGTDDQMMIKCKDNLMDKIDCNRLIETIDSLSNGLSTKLEVIRRLSSVPKDKPSLVLNDEALVKANERLDQTLCILENLRT